MNARVTKKMEERAFEREVAAGIKLLNKYRRGWKKKINLKKLDVGSGCNCVLGQVFGWYQYGRDTLADKLPDSIFNAYGDSKYDGEPLGPPDYGFLISLRHSSLEDHSVRKIGYDSLGDAQKELNREWQRQLKPLLDENREPK